MTTELTQPQSELGPVPANGQEQSQGHRGRRRRRKNKSSQASGAVASQQALQAQPLQADPAAQHPMPPAKHKPAPQHQGGQQGGRQGGHQNQGRKKKKFFQKGSAPAAQPGNSISAPPQGKRKARQKGAREFVCQMDDKCRVGNGNIVLAP